MSGYLSISPSSGSANTTVNSTVSVQITNTGRSPKTATITFRDTSGHGAQSQVATITVQAAETYVMFSPKTYSSGPTSTSQTITGKSNRASLRFVKATGSADFTIGTTLTVTDAASRATTYTGTPGTVGGLACVDFTGIAEGSDAEYTFSLGITFTVNDTTSSRIMKLDAYNKNDTTEDTATNTQNGSNAYISIDPSTLTLGATSGSSGTIQVTANVSWEAKISYS